MCPVSMLVYMLNSQIFANAMKPQHTENTMFQHLPSWFLDMPLPHEAQSCLAITLPGYHSAWLSPCRDHTAEFTSKHWRELWTCIKDLDLCAYCAIPGPFIT